MHRRLEEIQEIEQHFTIREDSGAVDEVFSVDRNVPEKLKSSEAEPHSPVKIYYPKSQSTEKSSKWASLRNTMHFIRL